jgi:hypothetical protein
MPVDALHPDYSKHADAWQTVRDCVAGASAVKEAGTRYLPQLGGMSSDDYKAYKARAHFYGATGRTSQGLLGMVFRKKPTVEAPGLEDHLENITLSGTPFEVLAREITENVIEAGREGGLVDYDPDEGRAYVRAYTAEAMTYWHEGLKGGKKFLDRVILRETHEVEVDEFTSKEEPQYRVCDLDETGKYRQRIFRKKKQADGQKEEWVLAEGPFYPRGRASEPLTEIPFVFFGPSELSPSVQKPPLADLADANVGHYVADADIAHLLHFTALPTPVVIGANLREQMKADQEQGLTPQELRIGSSSAWDLPDGAKVEMLEFKGTGAEAYQKRQDRLEGRMVRLGAQILADQKREAETADAMQARSAGESSVLSMIAETVSRGLQLLLRWIARFERRPEDKIEVRLNKDFFDTKMSPEELKALVEGWVKGALADEDLVYNLEAGEVLKPGEAEKRLAALKAKRAKEEKMAEATPPPPPQPQPQPNPAPAPVS